MPSGIYPRTEEHCRLLALARLKARSPEAREKIRQAHLGSKHPHKSETIDKIRQSRLGQAVVWGKQHPMYGKHHTAETRKKMRDGLRSAWQDPEFRRERIEERKQLWQDPEYVAKQIKARNIKPNYPEQVLIKLFAEHKLPFKFVGDSEFILGGRCPDFLNTDGKKQVIELFGTYWHKLFDVAQRTEHYRQYGFQVLILWEEELDNPERLLKKVKKFARR